MNWDDVLRLGLALPGVEAGTSYGTPALRVRKKLLCRLQEDGETLVLPVSGLDEREALIENAPHVYFFTEHYRAYPTVLVRLAAAQDAHVAGLLTRTWRAAAPQRLVQAFDPGDARPGLR